jgi:hypothetical protein
MRPVLESFLKVSSILLVILVCSLASSSEEADKVKAAPPPSTSLETDVPDPYADHWGDLLVGSTMFYDGEYMINVSDWFWYGSYPSDRISYQIEVVSFPFVPDCFSFGSSTSSCMDGSTDRDFVTLADSELGQINHASGVGYGWQDNGWAIYRESDPDGFLGGGYSQPNGLVSNFYCAGVPSSTNRKLFPHTVLKHTLNLHDEAGEEIIDSISWLYDLTRGRMRNYPFNESNVCSVHMPQYDVIYFPRVNYDPVDSHVYYGYDDNSSWYTSPAAVNTGSINYYPASDIQWPLIDDFLYPPYPFGVFEGMDNLWIHPAPYTLIHSPLRNNQANAFAGYDEDGTYIQTKGSDQSIGGVYEGCPHTYEIDQAIDLTQINPDEEIIYNPREVSITTDESDPLVFPVGYTFLTVHGKYPDKQWVQDHNTYGYGDLRKVLAPSDQEDSVYTIESGAKLVIKPCVTIMDAVFIVKGTLEYSPHDTRGNFTIQVDGGDVINPSQAYHCNWPPIAK